MSIALPGPLECRRTESPEIDCRLSAKYLPLKETETEFPLIAALMVEICSPTSGLREERNIDFLAVSSESDTWANLSAKIERSEERRVGKEWRYRWAPDFLK